MNKYSRQKASTYALYRHANRGSASFIAPESTIAHFMDFIDPSAYVDAFGRGIQQGIQGIGEGLKNFLPPSIPSPSGAERLSDIPGAIPKQPDFLHKASDAIGNAYNRLKDVVERHPGRMIGSVAIGASTPFVGSAIIREINKRKGMRLAAQQAAAAAQQTPNLMQRAQALAGNPMARNLGIGALALGGLGAGVAGLNALARKDAYEQADYNHALTNQYVASFSRGNGTRFAARTY